MKKRWVWVGAIALLVLILLSLVAAPRTAPLQSGSTYSRFPDGYGAWYAFMQQQGISIQQWRKPLEQLTEPAQNRDPDGATSVRFPVAQAQTPLTLVQVNPGVGWWTGTPSEDWFKQGNVLVRLGENPPPTKAPFRSTLDSPVGKVKIETSRRLPPQQALLQDQYGAVVWREAIGKGQIISAATPHLAANAYQDEPGNFKFLQELVTAPGHPIFVDEYLHGYKDEETITQEASGGVLAYLARTPIAVVVVQAIVMLLVLVWGQNQRLGAPLKITEPQPDNSQAYIQALASVLHKANSSDFVVETIGKAEQLNVQRSLGLGTDLLEPSVVLAAWEQQTGRSAAELSAILALRTDKRHLSDEELLTWVRNIEAIRRHL
ncbi:DUF4350 domain-containing protein [Phormidium tenue FACHB-886]|nr:DUF4350 domain-containing protein [Phormidium tenue FACHB-886]